MFKGMHHSPTIAKWLKVMVVGVLEEATLCIQGSYWEILENVNFFLKIAHLKITEHCFGVAL